VLYEGSILHVTVEYVLKVFSEHVQLNKNVAWMLG